IQQSPPQYSALHIGGKRASKLAREGKVVVMEKRPVTVFSFEVVSFEEHLLVADIHVSKGTYIRSLARDLALACNSRGHLVDLVRTQIGPFLLQDAVPSTDTDALLASVGNTDALIRSIATMAILEVEDSHLFSLANGKYPEHCTTLRSSEDARYGAVYSKEGTLCCVLDLQDKRIIAQIHREQVRP
ncbi:MAG: tRNA pseudouridine(55) synthase TruB, partial [Sphaerochaeta sp.]|nr:tRNA pseudouridine(55) synthase TruB [Sphaerochaeta sp.]